MRDCPSCESSRWIDTHEHLVEEKHRLAKRRYEFSVLGLGKEGWLPEDWTALLADYSICGLISAGLSPEVAEDDLLGSGRDPLEKWDLLEPDLEASRNTGYVHAFDASTEALFGQRLSRTTVEQIDCDMRSLRQPGYFRDLPQSKAGIESCQIHTIDHDPFCESQCPVLLLQDLSLVPS